MQFKPFKFTLRQTHVQTHVQWILCENSSEWDFLTTTTTHSELTETEIYSITVLFLNYPEKRVLTQKIFSLFMLPYKIFRFYDKTINQTRHKQKQRLITVISIKNRFCIIRVWSVQPCCQEYSPYPHILYGGTINTFYNTQYRATRNRCIQGIEDVHVHLIHVRSSSFLWSKDCKSYDLPKSQIISFFIPAIETW